MKRKELIKKLEKKEKELKVAIDLGEKIGKEMVKTLSKHVYALLDLNNQLEWKPSRHLSVTISASVPC